ncbi:hypothetical protein [Blastopirellula marina]|nr:hypothetical protein [Blastopirellula marina]
MNMHEPNPFQTPSTIAEEVSTDSFPPSPWSALSLLSTALVLGFVVMLLAVAWQSDFSQTVPSQWTDYFFWLEVGLIQAIVLGLWLGAGRGHIAVRIVVGALLLYGQSWEMSRILSDVLPTYLTLTVATLAATIDTILLAISAQRTARRVAGSCMKIFLPAVLCGGYLYLTESDLADYYQFTLRSLGNPDRFISIVLAFALFGVVAGLHLLVRKHRLSWPWHVGSFLLLIPAPLLTSYLSGQSLVDLAVGELAVLVLVFAVDRMLQSFAGWFFPLPGNAEEAAEE